MGIRDLQQEADAFAAEAGRLRLERNAHAWRGVEILRARLATPAALALCFGAGFLLGQPDRGSARDRRRREDREAGDGGGGFLTGPLPALALRLASAFLAGAATRPPASAGAAAPSGPSSHEVPAGPTG